MDRNQFVEAGAIIANPQLALWHSFGNQVSAAFTRSNSIHFFGILRGLMTQPVMKAGLAGCLESDSMGCTHCSGI